MEPIEISKYLDMAVRRKYWIILPFLVTVLAGLGHALMTPKIYEAKTLILVQPQRVPQSLVRPLVTADIEDRLRTIGQQVTSRTNLELIISRYDLYAESEMFMETKVELVRKRIDVNVANTRGRGGSAFEISFRDSIPRRTMDIANALASNFISENLKVREAQAIGTSDFLADELESIRTRISKREEELKDYRKKYMGAVPEYLGANLRILERLQQEAEQLNNALRDAQNRKLMIQQQISQTEMMANQPGLMMEDDLDSGFPGAESGELEALRRQVKLLEVRYTKNHPDVRRLREMISKLEAEEAASAETQAGLETTQEEAMPEFSMGQNFLQPQLEQINAEIRGLQHEIAKVQEQTAMYRSRVEQTPERQLELLEITRDYDNLKALYDSMLNRKLEAEVSLNMEKKQKGEQFSIIDPARLPEKPVEPDVRRILMLTILLGLALGGGMAYGVEFLDTSFKNPEDLEKELKIPVLVSMPIRYTEREIKGQRRKRLLLACSVGLVFMASATAIVIAAKGFDGTVNYVKNLLNIV